MSERENVFMCVYVSVIERVREREWVSERDRVSVKNKDIERECVSVCAYVFDIERVSGCNEILFVLSSLHEQIHKMREGLSR